MKHNKNEKTIQLLLDVKAGGRRPRMPRPTVMASKKDKDYNNRRNNKVDLRKLDDF